MKSKSGLESRLPYLDLCPVAGSDVRYSPANFFSYALLWVPEQREQRWQHSTIQHYLGLDVVAGHDVTNGPQCGRNDALWHMSLKKTKQWSQWTKIHRLYTGRYYYLVLQPRGLKLQRASQPATRSINIISLSFLLVEHGTLSFSSVWKDSF